MWVASDSASLYPVLVEIETPHKAWFYGDRVEIHSDFTYAYGQLTEWRAWFDRAYNRTAFWSSTTLYRSRTRHVGVELLLLPIR